MRSGQRISGCAGADGQTIHREVQRFARKCAGAIEIERVGVSCRILPCAKHQIARFLQALLHAALVADFLIVRVRLIHLSGGIIAFARLIAAFAENVAQIGVIRGQILHVQIHQQVSHRRVLLLIVLCAGAVGNRAVVGGILRRGAIGSIGIVARLREELRCRQRKRIRHGFFALRIAHDFKLFIRVGIAGNAFQQRRRFV